MGTIWLLRHGQTTANAQHVIQGPRIDAPLSDLGVRQAASLGEALADRPIEAVYSSPLVRARSTARAGTALESVDDRRVRRLRHALARYAGELAPAHAGTRLDLVTMRVVHTDAGPRWAA